MMSEVIRIEDTEMQIREYAGQRVVTFKDIDAVHGNKAGTAKRNFERNKKHFIEEEDYILVTRENFKRDNLSLLNIDIPTRGITVLTESGYLLIAKSFNDDLAWKVQKQLVNAYFRMKEQNTLQQITDSPEYPKQIYQTSSTPVPKNPSWYHRNRRRMNRICEIADKPLTTLYHHILLRLGEEYDLQKANEIYKKEIGHAPKYALDIVSYFPELGRLADDFLDRLEKVQNEQ